MDLTTDYLGFKLPHPFISGAGPLSDSVESAKQVEDAGAAAIVMRSLFYEQIETDRQAPSPTTGGNSERRGQLQTAFPEPEPFTMSLEQYLAQVQKITAAVDIPVIASMNGFSPIGWFDSASELEKAGADAIELNLFYVADNFDEPAATVEQRAVDMVTSLKGLIKIPLAVKLSSFYTSIANFARKLEAAGTDGLVLFNRVFETDIDVETMKICPSPQLSDSKELLLRLRWLAILSGGLRKTTLAVSGGVHSAVDAIKAIMCGASAIQMVSALLKRGPGHLTDVRDYMMEWMQEKEYESLGQMRSTLSTMRTQVNYMRLMQTSQWA
ncbi:dihydroorotate dehydrogenase-like protein [bacterium]|nr:dihydroorotate dehydrogenase-like protein [bacterium]